MGAFKDLTGKKFGKLTVMSHAGFVLSKGGTKFQIWECVCDCGGKKTCKTINLTTGRNTSCGCNQSRGRPKHGLYYHPLRTTRASIIQRCENPNNTHYEDYGGRGISICREWRESLPAFVDYMISLGWTKYCGESIDRIDNNGNYEPGNVRFASKNTQARNTRRNRVVELNGESKTIAEWSEVLGVPYGRIQTRLFRGWSPERALTEESNK